MRNSIALSVLPGLALAVSNEEPRYLLTAEDVRPVLQQYAPDPFRHPGIWSLQAKDAFEADLKAMNTAAEAAAPKSVTPAAPSIGGMQRPTENFLRKVNSLIPEDATPKSAQAAPASDAEQPSQRFRPSDEGKGSASEPRYLRPYLLITAFFLAPAERKVFPGECKLRYRSSNESEVLQTFEEIELETGTEQGVKDGDLFRLYEVGDGFHSYTTGSFLGHLVRVNGIAEVLRAGSRHSVARLVRCFGTISRDSRAAPIGDLPVVRTAGYSPTQGPMRVGRIIWVTPPHQLPQPFSQVIMDEGADKGFQVGDFVYVFNRRNGRMTDKVLGNAVILRTDAHSSTLLLQDVEPGVIDPGDFVVAQLSAIR